MGDVYPAWCRSVEDVASHHGVDLGVGLTDEQVAAKREEYGFNELEKQPGKPLWQLVLEQFDDMLVKASEILLFGSGVTCRRRSPRSLQTHMDKHPMDYKFFVVRFNENVSVCKEVMYPNPQFYCATTKTVGLLSCGVGTACCRRCFISAGFLRQGIGGGGNQGLH
jgi:hypothetical protein